MGNKLATTKESSPPGCEKAGNISSGWSEDSSFAYYRKLLEVAKENFTIHSLGETPEVRGKQGKPALILRHDVDVSLKSALQMAIIENEYQVSSTYLVIPGYSLYDLEHRDSRRILQALIDLGHEIGLHFALDAENWQRSSDVDFLSEKILSTSNRLERIVGAPVRSISFHRPLLRFLRGPLLIGGLVNAYSRELMNWYLSDSNARWRNGEPIPQLKNPSKRLLQLLVHPIFWGERHLSLEDRIEEFFSQETVGKSPQFIKKIDEALLKDVGVIRSGLVEVRRKESMTLGKFDTDVAALTNRIRAHEKYSTKDLNAWIFTHLEAAPGHAILDLGCGTGKQTLPLAQAAGEGGHILAVDISLEALDKLFQAAKELQVENRISVLCSGLDELRGRFPSHSFDRALASYSIYYAQETKSVLEMVHDALKDKGIFFFCGPSKRNNYELKQFIYSLSGEEIQWNSKPSILMEDIVMGQASKIFSTVEMFTFDNPLTFDSAESLYTYWSSHNMYDEKIDQNFKSAAAKYFHNNSVFQSIKRVIGIKAIK